MNQLSIFGATTCLRQGSDIIQGGELVASATSWVIENGGILGVMATASGIWQIILFPTIATPAAGLTLLSGGIFTSTNLGTFNNTQAPAMTTPSATHLTSQGTAPTIAVGAAAGTGGSVGATITGHDMANGISVVTGASGQTSGVLATITFGSAFASAPNVSCTATNSSSALLPTGVTPVGVFVTTTTTTAVINVTAAPAAGTTYTFQLLAIQ